MSRRGRGGTPISLFSFQDIITSVTGIMILVTLILALDVIRRRQCAPDTQTAALTEELQQAAAHSQQVETALAASRQQVDALRQQLTSAEASLRESARHDAESLERQLRDLDVLNKLLATELSEAATRRQSAEGQRDKLSEEDARRADDRQTLTQLQQQVQAQLAELRNLKSANRVIYNAGAGQAKTPWLVELAPGKILAAEMGRRAAPQSFANVTAFLAWARGRSKAGEYFVLLVKPQSLADFKAARRGLEGAGFDLGFDLLAADQTAIDPRTGAASSGGNVP